jgi:hypothetical protein
MCLELIEIEFLAVGVHDISDTDGERGRLFVEENVKEGFARMCFHLWGVGGRGHDLWRVINDYV